MRRSQLKQYFQEILSFADDEDDVIVESNRITFQRLNQLVTAEVEEVNGSISIRYNGNIMPYRTFLAKELAHLDIMATKILQKYPDSDSIYVDTQAQFHKGVILSEGNAEDLLIDECRRRNDYETKICFVTADAGHGKTVLLRHLQTRIAQEYKRNNSDYIFWHIDLHGRDLLRLNEAMMYEVGILRLSGLYYNSIITLIRNGLIVLAIDGFDELAAEIGGEKVLGSLTNLVSELDGQGTLIAASRRTFFNTQDYLRRVKLLQSSIDQSCEFDELKLQNWKEKECVQYMSYHYSVAVANAEYHKMATMLRDTDSHPVIERPFLFTKLVNYAIDGDPTMKPSEFLTSGGDQFDSINKVIEAFIRREVQKWTYFDNQTGKPYLSFEQHVELLTEIAQEMWQTQKDFVSVETIQYIATLLMESWNIENQLKPQILRVVESHAFMVIAENGDNYRRFDHEEFKDYFIACYLAKILKYAVENDKFNNVKNFLYYSQMQESVARYLKKMVDDDDIMPVVRGLLEMKNKEWKPTYLQPNLGILLPYLLDDGVNPSEVVISDKLTFTSLVFENRLLRDLTFKDCTFINISFNNTKLYNVKFEDCTFTDIRFSTKSGNIFQNVVISQSSEINKVTKVDDNESNSYSEYSPYCIDVFLTKQGINRRVENTCSVIINKDSEFRKIVRRFINKFLKSTHQYEVNFEDDQEYYSMPAKMLTEEIIPLMERYKLIHLVTNKNTIQKASRAWALNDIEISDIYKAEENPKSPLFAFWKEVNEHE